LPSPEPSEPVIAPQHHSTRPLDLAAACIVVVLCLSWGFNQVATKLAIHDIPPLTQAAIRSAVGALIIATWCKLRGVKLSARDGTLWPGLTLGVFFAVEFMLIYQSLLYTTASRAVLFLYLAPFMVVVGARILLPIDRFSRAQWLGLGLSFAGMLVAFGLPIPAVDPRQALGDVMMVAAAAVWAASTLITKVTALVRASAEKLMLYQLLVSAPVMGLTAYVSGERVTHMPSAIAIGSLAYQTFWVVSVTFVLWYSLVTRYSASRLSAFTFLTPLFGVAAGHVVLGEPLTAAFIAAVALVAGGLMLVNRTK
jgi:drug/metabolite transporter (DMT)-like permease